MLKILLLVIYFAVINEFHYTKNASFYINASRKWLFSNYKYVELITILIKSLWNKTVVARLRKCHWLNAVKHKASALAIPFNLLIATSWNLNNYVNISVFIISRL